MTRHPWIARAVVAAALVLTPLASVAQTPLTTAAAGEFMGVWTMSLESPRGAFEQQLSLKDKDGKVMGEMTNQMDPTPQAIADVSKEGADLVLKFQGNFQGNPFDAKITLTPDGANKAKVLFDVNGGMFSMTGTAAKK